MAEFDISALQRMMSDKNFLAAYMLLKDSTLSKESQYEYTGKIVTSIMSELAPGTSQRDKTLYYRSLLLYIFEDIPGLARIYQRQLRLLEENKASFDLLREIRGLVEASKDKDEFKAKLEDTFDNIKEKIDDTTEDIKDGTAQKKAEDFFYLAGEGIKEGLKQFSSFIKNISEQPKQPGDDAKTDQPETPENEQNRSDEKKGDDET
jgi:hypothetical protein